MGEKVNSLKPISFPLAVVAVDDVRAFAPIDLTLKISEILDPDRSKEHDEILAHANLCLIAIRASARNKTSAKSNLAPVTKKMFRSDGKNQSLIGIITYL